MDAIECIKTRMSIRSFKPEPVPRDLLLDVIDAAKWSPSYKNSQPWEVIILSGEKKEALSKMMIELLEGGAEPTPDLPAPRSWPPALKCRSRMHYFLADRQAKLIDSAARALLLDDDGFVTEATTASLLTYFEGEGLVVPPSEKILHGISLQFVAELALKLGLPFTERELRPEDVALADEAMLASTTSCLLPVVRLNGRPIGSGQPGKVFNRLIAAWSDAVGVDIPAQATRSFNR